MVWLSILQGKVIVTSKTGSHCLPILIGEVVVAEIVVNNCKFTHI